MALMSWGMGSTAVSASPQQRRKFGSYFQKVMVQLVHCQSWGDGSLSCPDSRYNWFRRAWVCLLYRIVGLFMYKLTFSAMKGFPKICLKSQCIYRDCFHFSNSALGTGAVKAGKWEKMGSYYTPASVSGTVSLGWLEKTDSFLGFRLSNYYSKAAGCSHDSAIPKLSAREKGLRTWKACKRISGL